MFNTRKSVLNKLIVSISLSTICLSLMIDCATTKSDWNKATKINTIEAYNEFLEKHKDSEYSPSANNRINEIIILSEFDKVKDIKTYDSKVRKYENYLKAHDTQYFIIKSKLKNVIDDQSIQDYLIYLAKSQTYNIETSDTRIQIGKMSDLNISWTGRVSDIFNKLNIKNNNIDVKYETAKTMENWFCNIYLSTNYPESKMYLPNGDIITFYSHPFDEMKFQWPSMFGKQNKNGILNGDIPGASSISVKSGKGVVIVRNNFSKYLYSKKAYLVNLNKSN